MGNSWKYAQVLEFPSDIICECGHDRNAHNNRHGFCIMCMNRRTRCEKFHKWSVEHVRRFWQIINIGLNFWTNTRQTMLDDYMNTRGHSIED